MDFLELARARVAGPGLGLCGASSSACCLPYLTDAVGTDAASAITPAGKVDAVSGSCTAHGRVLKRGDVVQVSDTIEVPAGGRLKLRMADWSLISIAADSSMTVASDHIGSAGRHAKLSLTRGLLRAVVVAVGGPSTFEVSTAVGTASVRSADADWFRSN